MAPEHPFPAAVDDAVAVYKELLKSYKPEHIAVYGTSAGAILTAEFAVKVKQLGTAGTGGAGGSSPGWVILRARRIRGACIRSMASRGTWRIRPRLKRTAGMWGKTDPKDPVLSPLYSDLHGLPPTLFITSTRDALLSGDVDPAPGVPACRGAGGIAGVRGAAARVLE